MFDAQQQGASGRRSGLQLWLLLELLAQFIGECFDARSCSMQ
jgi:hypothetical protein